MGKRRWAGVGFLTLTSAPRGASPRGSGHARGHLFDSRADIRPVEVRAKAQFLLRDSSSQAKPAEITAKQDSRIGSALPAMQANVKGT